MSRRLDLIFMGTPEFSATILNALVEAGHSIRAVYTQPPRPARRGHKFQASPVQLFAEAHALPVRFPTILREAGAQAEFAGFAADAAVVAAYGLILPPPVLAAPRLGCINVHASLLPRWRGAAPIQRAILAGDTETGVSIMQMEAGLDTGPILLRRAVPLGPQTTAAGLTECLAALGARMVVDVLDELALGTATPQPQLQEGATYAKKITRDEAWLDWRRAAVVLERQVRALCGGVFLYGDERIRVLAAAALEGPEAAPPGEVLDEILSIACGAGVFRPLLVQRPGRTPQEAAAFLRGFTIAPGTLLPCPATN